MGSANPVIPDAVPLAGESCDRESLPRVLVVDDDPHQLSGLKRSLRRHAHVSTATSADEALRRIRAGDQIEVVVSDLRMPGLDGLALLARLRELDPSVPGILLSGHADLPAALAVINQGGIHRFLTKPCHSEVLREAIDSAARIHRERRQRLHACLDELAAMREEALRANRSRARFLGMLAHELRTPLTAMVGFADLLGQSSDLPDHDRMAVDRILGAGQHLQELITNLGQLGHGADRASSPDTVDLEAVVAEAVELIHALAEQHMVTLPDAAGLAGLSVHADVTRVRQVVVNLLTNAVKYNRPGGRVTVTGHELGDEVALDVTDTGPGIPAGRLHRVFVPFDRLGAEEGVAAGTGIGLAIVRDLTEAMGGTVRVHASSPEGTTFRVLLPGAAEQAPEEAAEDHLDHGGAPECHED